LKQVYVDTSAYIAVLLGDRLGAKLVPLLERSRWYSSVLLVIESRRTLVRLAREHVLTPKQLAEAQARVTVDIERFTLLNLDLTLCDSLVFPAVTTPKSLDLIHLRTALFFRAREGVDAFLTLDNAQRISAQELGLPIA
jgi:PIN domain nuclease of toxin-antitoxin system